MPLVPEFDERRSRRFQNIVDAFLSQPCLPFAHVLSAERIERIFARHGNLFATNAIYSSAVMVWSFLGQVLRDGKEASCQAAVARVVTHCQQQDAEPPTADTGDYCKARAKLSQAALRELATEIAGEVEDHTAPTWLFKNQFHAKLIDGFTFTMPDTEKNQKKFPHPRTQTRGVGLPIARAVAILSLATACAMDAAYGPYSGKETGESALLRTLLGSLSKGDVAVMDRYYCSFWMIALLLAQGTQVCARKHHLRHSDFRRGKRLGKYDHLIIWTRPQQPTWMDEAMYAQIPATLVLREIRYNIVEPGRRTRSIDVITTLVDVDEFTQEEIAQLYGFRWNSELDIRSIKDSLNLGHLRCKSPEMVGREFWTTLLGYNLIRITAAGAALLHNKQPRQISFVSTCQYVLSSWMLLSCGLVAASKLCSLIATSLSQIASCEVGNRPGRLEPRVLKRRRHGYKLMQQPRHVLRTQLRKKCT
jgi:hypothetical protein